MAHVERDAHAAAVLVERMGQARLDQAPIWDDLATFDGRPWCGRVDLITAGFPCPDFSSAGRRAGVDGIHWLWPEVSRITSEVGPRFVILENVPGLVGLGGLTRVLSDLAELGFDAEWGVLGADDVGAPHGRERIWIVAGVTILNDPGGRLPCMAHTVQRDGQSVSDSIAGSVRTWVLGHHARRCTPVADADVITGRFAARNAVAGNGGQAIQPGQVEPGRCRGPEPWPPRRDDGPGWLRWITSGGPQPVLRRDTDGPPNGLADALHLGGNGLVPQAAAHAVRQLLDRRGWELT